jgi:hypothetical protein
MVAGGGDSEIDQGSSLARNRPRNEYDTGSVETDNLQSTDQTVSASGLSDAGEDGPAIIDVSKLTTMKVLDKRSSSSGVEYKCEFEALWLAADLAERAQMGRVRIRSYENGLVRDRRLKTLRVGKRKFSEM